MQVITLEKGIFPTQFWRLPKTGWIASTVKKGKGKACSSEPIVFVPGKLPIVYDRKGTFACQNRKLYFMPKGKHEFLPIDENGSITDTSSKSIPAEYHNCHPEYKVKYYEQIHPTYYDLLTIAAGLVDGGIVIFRKSDKKVYTLNVQGRNPCMSSDGATLICHYDNMVYMIDNPLW